MSTDTTKTIPTFEGILKGEALEPFFGSFWTGQKNSPAGETSPPEATFSRKKAK